MKGNNKELIDVIRQQLRNAEERPYKPGAWEAFLDNYDDAPKRKRIVPLWVAAAASVAVLAFGSIYVFQNNESSSTKEQVFTHVETQKILPLDSESNVVPEAIDNNTEAEIQGVQSHGKLIATNNTNNFSYDSGENSHHELNYGYSESTLRNEGLEGAFAPASLRVFHKQPQIASKSPHTRDELPTSLFPEEIEEIAPQDVKSVNKGDLLASSYDQAFDTTTDLSPNHVRPSKNLKLGAFVSPSATDQRIDLGGGMVVAYQFSDKVSVRTGASFNQYAVGISGSSARSEDGLQQSAPTVSGGAALVSENVAYRTNNVMMPNLNSVSSKMQTLDVPLEIKYNIINDYYVVGGASYAFVLSQERYNHFSEYTDAITYSSASNSDKPTSTPQKTVERKVKSNNENVDTDGLGGFVNFAIGRKTGITKSLNISVEPFVKIPVGSFKQTDMNYTNGGIRIITSF